MHNFCTQHYSSTAAKPASVLCAQKYAALFNAVLNQFNLFIKVTHSWSDFRLRM